jgi:hypothetical protein
LSSNRGAGRVNGDGERDDEDDGDVREGVCAMVPMHTTKAARADTVWQTYTIMMAVLLANMGRYHDSIINSRWNRDVATLVLGHIFLLPSLPSLPSLPLPRASDAYDMRDDVKKMRFTDDCRSVIAFD